MSGTTPCSACRAPIPNIVAAAPFCPFCGTQKPTRDLPAVIAEAQARARAQEQARPAREEIFSKRGRDLCLTFDPRAGFALLGPAEPKGEAPRLRAYDVCNQRVAWEAMLGEPGVGNVSYEALAVRNGNVYVGLGRSLCVLDLLTGAEKWRAELSDKLAYDSSDFATRGMRVIDAAPAGAPGVVWAVAVDDVISAFDRDTGKRLWREARENMPRRILPFGAGLLLVQTGEAIELVDPATKKVLDRLQGRIERWDMDGSCGLLQVDRWGFRERDGVLVHDFATKKELLFEALEDLEDDVPTVAANGRVFCAMESGAKLVAAPKPKPVELVPAFHIRAMVMCGPTLMVLLRKHHGTSVRRVVGVDPATLTIRFDLGELPERPSDNWTTQLCSNGQVTVLAHGHATDSRSCDLLALDARGNSAWRVTVGEWRAHYFLGGYVAVFSSWGWQILRPDNGEVFAEFKH